MIAGREALGAFVEQGASRPVERMPTREPPPNVRLQLLNQPENISLVRTILTGVAETIELPPAALDDITTAVTEAANNVVLHAYQGGHGPLEVDIHIAEGLITVVVRDEGIGIVGIPGQTPALDESILGLGGIDEGSLKLGLPVIQALAARVEFDQRSSGGTEVRMTFATPQSTSLPATAHDELELPLFELARVEQPELIAAATIAITPDRLARMVLPRLICALAARANFSTDRLSDAQLLADAIAAQAFQSIIGSHLGVWIAVEPRRVELHIGPLPADHAAGPPSTSSVLGELAPVIETLTDHHSLAQAGPGAVLALQLIDSR